MNTDAAQILDTYLRQLRGALRPMAAAQANDIVQEIASHVTDRALIDGQLDGPTVTATLRQLGDARELAGRFLQNAAAYGRAPAKSKLLLMLGRLRQLVTALGRLLLAAGAYAVSGVALACALAKPWYGDRVGLWVMTDIDGDLTYQLGRVATVPTAANELLGLWIVPLGLSIGLTAAALTTLWLRRVWQNQRPTRHLTTLA
jgi:hypothetical protein